MGTHKALKPRNRSPLCAQILAEAAPRLGAALDSTQFGFLCDKAGRMFVPRYIDAVYRLRRCAVAAFVGQECGHRGRG